MAETTTQFADERVTRSFLRTVELPLGAGTFALITLDNGFDHTKPNTLGPATLLELDAAITAAYETAGVVGVGVTGKPFILAAGADLKGIGLVSTKEQAREIVHLGHRVLRRLGEGPVPTFGFINGLALGGGLELPLHCTYRTVQSTAPALALPECFLGLLPGWGGAWLLPNLIGPDRAVTVIIENPLAQNRMLNGEQTAELGLADAVFEAADFLEQSLLWAARVLTGDVVVEPAGGPSRTVASRGPRPRPTARSTSSRRPVRRPATRASRRRTRRCPSSS